MSKKSLSPALPGKTTRLSLILLTPNIAFERDSQPTRHGAGAGPQSQSRRYHPYQNASRPRAPESSLVASSQQTTGSSLITNYFQPRQRRTREEQEVSQARQPSPEIATGSRSEPQSSQRQDTRARSPIVIPDDPEPPEI